MGKTGGGLAAVLFFALLLSLAASYLQINKGFSYFRATFEYPEGAAAYSEKAVPFLVFIILQVAVLFYLGTRHGLVSIVFCDLLLFVLYFVSLYTPYYPTMALPAVFAAGAAYYYARDGLGFEKTLEKLGFFSSNIFVDTVFGFAGAVAAILIVAVLAFALGMIGITDDSLVRTHVLDLPVFVALWAMTFSPIGEEIFFRGLLFRKFGLLASSALFAAAHVTYGSVMELVGAFAIAALFCYMTARRKSIIPAIIAHMVFNCFSILSMLLSS
jgi:membrane protease YdiL (CAAX protease family)